ncbi:hypothetical protein HanXRQr2_Chr17g0821571 [Helianthus annuus]|uniref:Uncharacterized protein n=1 Tax=Helianthus annuus TaxID=4232 RepID=A0A9K3DMU6_HELAN|nr:hypothetical protein HanXRQr2_Chr17g0821571 [Helianthus annuus]
MYASSLVAPIDWAILKHASSASYSALLLEHSKSNRRAYISLISSGLINMRHAPEPFPLDDPSVYNFQVCLAVLDSGMSWTTGSCITSPSGISGKKSAITCPLIVVRFQYSISRAPNSSAHLANLPEISGLCKICFSG